MLLLEIGLLALQVWGLGRREPMNQITGLMTSTPRPDCRALRTPGNLRRAHELFRPQGLRGLDARGSVRRPDRQSLRDNKPWLALHCVSPFGSVSARL